MGFGMGCGLLKTRKVVGLAADRAELVILCTTYSHRVGGSSGPGSALVAVLSLLLSLSGSCPGHVVYIGTLRVSRIIQWWVGKGGGKWADLFPAVGMGGGQKEACMDEAMRTVERRSVST
jgi:hypothetical protein